MEKCCQVTDGDDWRTLLSFLPSGWEEKARELGAFVRARKFSSPEVLLRVLFMHIAEGHSLRSTSALAKQTGVANASDVAILKRLAASNEWLRWMANGVKNKWFNSKSLDDTCACDRIRVVDGTTIQEPGATGSTWKIHYSITLNSLHCDEVIVSDPKTGEGLWNFSINKGDLVIADRGFCHRRGICYVVENSGNVIVRIKHKMPFSTRDGHKLDVLSLVKKIRVDEIGDWESCVVIDGKQIHGRICAIKKSKAAADKEIKRILQSASKKGNKVLDSTLEAANYIIVFTSLSSDFDARRVFEYYRMRWQVELSFKRLKSILGIGHLKKYDELSAKAWLHGKLLVAFLIEAISSAGVAFFPWGYPLSGRKP